MDNESKLYVKRLLVSGDALVTQFKSGAGGGAVSDVWRRFGRIVMRDSGDVVGGVVACALCYKVYSYKNSSQGTSTLRLHICDDPAPAATPARTKGMVRGRVRRRYSREELEAAVAAVREGRLNLNAAANHFGVPKSTLHYVVSGKTSARTPAVGHLSKGLELEVARTLAALAHDGLRLRWDTLEEVLERRLRRPLPSLGPLFWNQFRRRHPELEFVFANMAPKDTPGTSEASWPALNSAHVVQRLKAGDTLNAPQSMTQREVKPILPKPSSASTPPYLAEDDSPRPPPQPKRPPPQRKPPAPEEETESQQVCLRWNSFHSNMENMFPLLLHKEKFVDVTLACEGRFIKCHKVVLSSCSPYLERLLSENPCKHPIVLMPKDVPFWALRAIVEFMYRGEVNVEHEQLAALLAAAEALQVKGLAGDTGTQPDKKKEPRPSVPKRKRVESPKQQQAQQSSSGAPPIKKERESSPQTATSATPNSAPKRPPMAPQLAESLRGLSPGIEITPLVTFEEIKTEPLDHDADSNDDASLEHSDTFAMSKGYDDGEESLPVSHVESLIEEEDTDDPGDLNDSSHHPDPNDLLATEMDPMDDDCDDSVNVYGENGMDFGECGLSEEASDLVETYTDVCTEDDPGEEGT